MLFRTRVLVIEAFSILQQDYRESIVRRRGSDEERYIGTSSFLNMCRLASISAHFTVQNDYPAVVIIACDTVRIDDGG